MKFVFKNRLAAIVNIIKFLKLNESIIELFILESGKWEILRISSYKLVM